MTTSPPTRDELLAVIRELAEKAVPIVAQRNSAYAGGGDVFGNLNLIETLSSGDIRTETGIVIRMGDKVSRLYSLTARNVPENDESLEDTLIDLLGYSALLLLRHRTRQTSPPTRVPADDAADNPLYGTYRKIPPDERLYTPNGHNFVSEPDGEPFKYRCSRCQLRVNVPYAELAKVEGPCS